MLYKYITEINQTGIMLNNIRKIRLENGVSQASMVIKLGYSQPRMSQYEAGQRDPSLRECRRIVKAFRKHGIKGCTLSSVFPDEDAISQEDAA